MDDRFEARLRERLRLLEVAVPPETRVESAAPATLRRSTVRLVGAPSIGLAAGLGIVLVAAILWSVAAPKTATAAPSQPTVVMGPAGFPVSVDGQAVYRFEDAKTWESVTGSFFVAAGAPYGPPSCPVPNPSPAPELLAESHFFTQCPEVILGYTSSFKNGGFTGVGVAPKGLPLEAIAGWGGHIVVFRAHTHDPEAAGCQPADLARCEDALVVESIVWPYLPTSIDGEHVYQGSEVSSGALQKLNASFLLGGLVRMSEGNLLSECESSAAARKLAISCISPYITDLGGAWIAPESTGGLTNGWVVIVRAHFDQTLAAQCPADIRYQCQQAVIVDSVVWSSNPYASNGATPSPNG